MRGRGFRFVGKVKTPFVAATPRQSDISEPENRIRTGPPVLAVLPFSSQGIDLEQSAVSEAVPAELIAALSKVRSIRVLARGTTFRLKQSQHALDGIRARLGANYVLTGSVSKIERQVQTVVELVDTKTQHVIWSDDFSASLDDLPTIGGKITRSVVNALELRIAQNEADAVLNVRSDDLDAWSNYHLGVRHLYRFNAPDNEKAAHYFQNALAQNPEFARAVAGLSYTELENYNLGFGTEKQSHLKKTHEYAERAVDLDPFDPFCNLVLARANWAGSELDGAISWANRAIDLNPNYAFGYYNLGKFSAIDCASTSAHRHLQSAVSLSPLDAHMQSMLSARALAAFVEDDAEAAQQFAGLSLRAPNPHLYVCLFAAAISAAYEDHGNLNRAKRRIAKLGGAFDRQHFTSLFTLSDERKASHLMQTIDGLGFSPTAA